VKVAIVGHRGVGKTTFLRRVERVFREAGLTGHYLDLDHEIERRRATSIPEIFSRGGVTEFRRIESETFAELDRELDSLPNVFVAMGGGFDPALIPEAWIVLWLRRPSDGMGRVFLERPRLDFSMDPLAEYFSVYEMRQKRFMARADETLILPEGMDVDSAYGELEAKFLVLRFGAPAVAALHLGGARHAPAVAALHLGGARHAPAVAALHLGGAITLLPPHFRNSESFRNWVEFRLQSGVRWFELRDDILSSDQLNQAISLLPREKIFISFREANRMEQTRALVSQGFSFDWPLELGVPPPGVEPFVLSFHGRGPEMTVERALAELPAVAGKTIIKAALPVGSLKDLRIGDLWQRQDPTRRIFLPCSSDGRWAWYRLHRAPDYELNFLRESDGSGKDQPTMLEWAQRLQVSSAEFAAVLGDPVDHSRSPAAHSKFCRGIGLPYYRITLSEQEIEAGGLNLLREFGLIQASVTAPLKEVCFRKCDGRASKFASSNTLLWDPAAAQWKGYNTDLDGLHHALAEAKAAFGPWKEVAVWGGGGTLEVLRMALPDANFFSARAGVNRAPGGAAAGEISPDLLIWAPGAMRAEIQFPPVSWSPRFVFDLNYSENSPGRTYALSCGARYFSGLSMFQAQAEAQQKIWSRI
jgi:shikimate 5-dehydrogenase/shikimate kinase